MINVWIGFLPLKGVRTFGVKGVRIFGHKLTLLLKMRMRSINVAIQEVWLQVRGTFYFTLNAPQALSDDGMYKYSFSNKKTRERNKL